MSRIVTIGAAQLGPIARTESRAQAVARLMALMRQAASHGCDVVVFPECALTAFFPHWYYDRQDDIDAYFEREMPNAATQPLFDCARELGIGFYLGFAELAIEGHVTRRFNSSILVDKTVTGEQDGVAVIPAKLIGDIARALPPGKVEITVEGEDARIEAQRAQFTMRTIPARLSSSATR